MELDPAALLATDRRLRALARELVGESAGADDLAQEAWLASLQRPAGIESFPAWLAAVARRLAGRSRRSRIRRTAREEDAARAEAIPSTAEILEREEARQRVVAAVLALEEPLRTTLVLRFLEDLPPRTVAARMSVPVETVRTRTKRGLELLRARLDAGFGGRERWMPAAIALASGPRSPLAPTIAALSVPTKLAAAMTVVALLAWLLWLRAHEGPGPGSVQVGGAPFRIDPLDEERTSELREESFHGEPRVSAAAAEVPEPEPVGSLRVNVRWGAPGAAEGISVRVTSDELENPDLSVLEGVTDATGAARFDGLPAGGARVWVDRHFGDPKEVVIATGRTTDVEIRLPRGFDIAGIAEDERGVPVAGAEIRLGNYPDLAHAPAVARSAADGTFAVRSVTHACLGARAIGFRPSKIEHVFAAEGSSVEVRLVLRDGGGEVVGSVRGPTGRPVAEAIVRVGPTGPETFAGGDSRIDADWGAFARSDEQGRFRVQGVASGACPVVLRAAGFALLRGEVDVPAGGSASYDAVLLPEPAVEGHVRDALGAPVPGAVVRVGEDAGPFRASARSHDDGSFRVGALEADRVLAATIEDPRGSTRTEFRSLAGRAVTWEAVLGSTGEIRGRVIDERGEPLSAWIVRLESQEPPEVDPSDGMRLTGADGAFAFDRVLDRPHLFTVTGRGTRATSIQQFGVRPSRDELVLRVPDARIPSARIVGAVLDEQGRPVPTAQLVPMSFDAFSVAVETCDPDTGRFAIGPLPPGKVSLHVWTPQRGEIVLAPHELLAGETWDIGEIRLAPEGRLRVRLAGDLAPGEGVELALDTLPGRGSLFADTGSERLSLPLAPGSHTLRVGGGSYEELALPFEIRSGAETLLEVPLRRGWRTVVAARVPNSVAWIELRVTLPGGVLERMLYERRDDLLLGTLHLPAGTFAVEAVSGGRSVLGTLVVEPLDREEIALVLALD